MLGQGPSPTADESLLRDGSDVMSSVAEEGGAALSQILVELDLHADSTNETSTYRSRDISAP
jgi:hypothetical protein